MSTKAYIQSLTDDKTDYELGKRVRAHLISKGLEQLMEETYDPEAAVGALQDGLKKGLMALGLDIMDPSIADTPKRYACMVVGELTKGLNYEFFPKCTTTPNGVDAPEQEGPIGVAQRTGGYNQMVRVTEIETISLCEHHLQTIDGFTYIAYIPSTKVLGLSKFARVTDFFARRPQIQERMTEQIYEALTIILETDDIAIVQDATHYCMKARGALQRNSRTQTNKMGGRFMSQPALREEFLHGIR